MPPLDPAESDGPEFAGLFDQLASLGLSGDGCVEVVDLIPLSAAEIEVVEEVRRLWSEQIPSGLERGSMMAGAAPARVLRFVPGDAARLTLFGLAIGSVASVACARLVRSMLFGVEAADPLTYLSAIAVLAAAGVLAALYPAVRAAKLDPAKVLRAE